MENGLEGSNSTRPVRFKKVPIKFADAADSLTDIYSEQQLSSKKCAFFMFFCHEKEMLVF